MAPHKSLILATTLLLLCPAIRAHYNLMSPMPYNPIDCNPPDCRGPCPPIFKSGGARARNTPQNPSAVWKRGQEVDIVWHRNNHEGGYYRRSLVPVKYMNDKAWHKKTAFEWGCWEQGKFDCVRPGMTKFQRDECGTDKNGAAYRNKMTVPDVFPDGDYVFAMVWYGGVHFRRKMPFFSDYYTCSYVKIRGGALGAEVKPIYTPGRSHRTDHPVGTCLSGKLNIGECGGEECKQSDPIFKSRPGAFLNGRTPPNVKLSDLDKDAVVVPESKSMDVLDMTPVSQEAQVIENGKKEEQVDAKMVKEEMKTKKAVDMTPVSEPPMKPTATPSMKPTATPSPKPKNTDTGNGQMWKGQTVPQWPTGSWGAKNSPLYNQQRNKWWIRRNWCGRNRDFPDCYVGQ